MSKFKSAVRMDKHGLFVITNGTRFRPGGLNGYDHAYDMSDPGLKIGDKVWARHISQTPLARITTVDDKTVVWGCEYLHKLPEEEVR